MATESLKCWIKLLKLFTQVSHCGPRASGWNSSTKAHTDNVKITKAIFWSPVHSSSMKVLAFHACTGWSASFLFSHITNEPQHDKTNKMICVPNEESDQPGHPPSLIRVFAVRMKNPWVLGYTLIAQWRLIRLGRCPGWSESSLGAQVILLVLSCSGSNMS